MGRLNEYVPKNVQYSILVNGDQLGQISLGRQLRQGDPMSSYLFILCSEGIFVSYKTVWIEGTFM